MLARTAAVIPSLCTSAQPSAGETADLIRTIRDEDVKAIAANTGALVDGLTGGEQACAIDD